MKESGKCPKCGSSNVSGPYRKIEGVLFLTTIRRKVGQKGYICSDCGYVEFYVAKERLEYVRKYASQPVIICSSCNAELERGATRCHRCGWDSSDR